MMRLDKHGGKSFDYYLLDGQTKRTENKIHTKKNQ